MSRRGRRSFLSAHTPRAATRGDFHGLSPTSRPRITGFMYPILFCSPRCNPACIIAGLVCAAPQAYSGEYNRIVPGRYMHMNHMCIQEQRSVS